MTHFNKLLFKQFADIAKGLGNANRIELLELLSQCEYSVEELAKLSHLTIANTSQHLQLLRTVGLVKTRRDAQRIYYSLSGEDVLVLFQSLRKVGENHIETVNELIDDYLHSKDSLEAISHHELFDGLEAGAITVLDVRPSTEYAAGHIPGALNITVEELREKFSELDNTQEIVAYCRGPHCILSFEAVEFLREKGFKVHRLEDGFPEWKSAGLPTQHP